MSQMVPILRKDRKDRIEEVFKEEARDFVNDFFTSTEKINLPKRLGIYILLTNNTDYLNIKDMLRVNVPTIWRVKSRIVKDGMEGLRKFINKILRENKPKQEAVLLRSRYHHRPKNQNVFPTVIFLTNSH